METHVKDNIESLFQKTGDYIETRADLYKLKAIDKSTDVLSSLLSKLIVYIVFVIFIFLINVALSLFIGELLGKAYYGFLVMSGLYLLIGLAFSYNRKRWFKEPLLDKFIDKFLK